MNNKQFKELTTNELNKVIGGNGAINNYFWGLLFKPKK
ncbi:MAG: bacteriocin class II family protein [Streptococcaceae bacterium]|jgi:bacteriocin-like protein|nr:bacteriocin class II family protein [Streptococcaceae bacterium]